LTIACPAPQDYRLDICATTTSDVQPNDVGITNQAIPAGRCAVLRHIGNDDTLGQSVTYLYNQWLADSGEQLRDFPLFFERVSFFPEVAEHQMITDIYLPLR
jgi:AraC family transcriptional regulator